MERAWERGINNTSENIFPKSLEECRSSFTVWNKNNFGHVGRKVAYLQEQLQRLECQHDALVNMEEIQNTKMELNKMLDIEEILWKQQSRNSWLKEGDRNTSFFHTKALNRHQRNSILGVKDNNGSWQEDADVIGKIFVDYYENLFSTSNQTINDEMISAIHVKVSTQMNSVLINDFHAHEVERALKQMHPITAPGPYGMPPLFYQHFWPTVGNVVIKTLLNFLNRGIIPPKFNETHIVLIPKVKNPQLVTDYRPISLCNVIYKLA